MKIGLTGGLASGKSRVAKSLGEHGAILIDADAIARELTAPGRPLVLEIGQIWPDVVTEGVLNRKKLGEVVFANPDERRRLEGLLHPAILREIESRLVAIPPGEIAVVEVPLLYEVGLEDWFDLILVVYAPREVRLTRVMERDELPWIQAQNRLDSQIPLEEKVAKADWVIENTGSWAETQEKIDTFWRWVKEEKC